MRYWPIRWLLLLTMAGWSTAAPAQTFSDNPETLIAEARRLRDAARFESALDVATRAVTRAAQMHGESHASFGLALEVRARVLRDLDRHREAVPLLRRAVTIVEQARGPDHADLALVQRSLGQAVQNADRAEAERLLTRSLAIREARFGPDSGEVAESLATLGNIRHNQGQLEDAEQLYQRSLDIRQRVNGTQSREYALALTNIGSLRNAQGRYAEAAAQFREALAVREGVLDASHPDIAQSLSNLASAQLSLALYREVEPLLKRALAITEETFGLSHTRVESPLTNLAGLYELQGRHREAEPLFRRSVALVEATERKDTNEHAFVLNNLAVSLHLQKRHDDAEPIYIHALAIREARLGDDHPLVAQSLNNLGGLLQARKKFGEAEARYSRALAIRKQRLGEDHPLVASTLVNIGLLHFEAGRPAQAVEQLEKALALRQLRFGADHPLVAETASDLGGIASASDDWATAVRHLTRATDIYIRRATTGVMRRGEAQNWPNHFLGLAKALYYAAPTPAARDRDAERAFMLAQWARNSKAGASVAQMAARGAGGTPALAALVREQQDAVDELRQMDEALTQAAAAAPDRRDQNAEAGRRAEINALSTRLTDIDVRLKADFPSYQALASAQPLTLSEIQALLGTDEALVMFIVLFDDRQPQKEETFIWAVTKTEARWVRSPLGRDGLRREVAALRCGLDTIAWGTKDSACPSLTGASFTIPDQNAGRLPPFDTARAHRLYTSLFGGIANLLKGKHLLLVPHDVLQTLPFQVLVKSRPRGADLSRADWLMREHVTTVLPSVGALASLRRDARASNAPRAFVGFANPWLDGPDGRYALAARQARAANACPDGRINVASTTTRRARLARATALRSIDPADIRRQTPLPETADEVCAAARDQGAAAEDIFLGDRARETEVKTLSANGRLASYKIVHFATHGTVAGDVGGTSEPGLILTPPETASTRDDGYLSAAEVAGLKLDADLVILSACNTAAGGSAGRDTETLSGLARAFFYAHARAVMVSHWAVDSQATVALVTGAVRYMQRGDLGRPVGRADALRRAMIDLVNARSPRLAHPSLWAPFVLVGEGALR